MLYPFTKSISNQFESISFNQCLKVFKKHLLCIVTHNDLDISSYTELLGKCKINYIIEYFNNEYFNGVSGYNKLMLSREFYLRFKNYEYILIYQLDAYVFRDELDYWCGQGYDYIGAPWIFKNYRNRHPLKTIVFKFPANLSAG